MPSIKLIKIWLNKKSQNAIINNHHQVSVSSGKQQEPITGFQHFYQLLRRKYKIGTETCFQIICNQEDEWITDAE